MAKKTRKRVSEIAEESEPTVFASIPVKDLPEPIKSRHKAREEKLDAMSKQRNKLHEEGEKDIADLVKIIKDKDDK